LQIKTFEDFCKVLHTAGFSLGGGNSEGIFVAVPFNWNEEPPYDTPVRWHTGDRETDPWEWRIRVLDEHKDIAYGKLFFSKSGYITKEWYPYFLAVRRAGMSFGESYEDGNMSHFAKRIYDLLCENEQLALDEIKRFGEFSKEDKYKFDRAITELQMKMFITMCGRAQKHSKTGEEYGWSSTVFCTAENFFPKIVFDTANGIGREEAEAKITEQIYKLNPFAEIKKIKKFING